MNDNNKQPEELLDEQLEQVTGGKGGKCPAGISEAPEAILKKLQGTTEISIKRKNL